MPKNKRNPKQTTKKVKIIGKQEYINSNTGEVEDFQVIQMEERDFNFHKLWLGHILNSLDLIGNKKIKVLTYILENLNSENLFISTQRQVADKLNFSLQTVSETIVMLKESDFLKQISNGVYQVNPDKIFKGSKNKRMKVLLEYNDLNDPLYDEYKEKENLKKNMITELKKLSRDDLLKKLGQADESPITLKLTNQELITLIIKDEFPNE